MARPATGSVVERDGVRGRSFALRYRVPGHGRVHEVLGRHPEWDRKNAEQVLADRLAQVRLGIWKPQRPERVEVAPTSRSVHVFSSEWFERRRFEVGERTVEHWRWALSNHLLPVLGQYEIGEIGPEQIDMFKSAKLRERERYERASENERTTTPRPLANGSINKCLKVLAMVIDDAITYGLHGGPNPCRGRLLKASKPRRTWLEADEAGALIEAAGGHRALIASEILAGLRVNELVELRWRSVDLARGKLTVESSKTDAGRREIDLSPSLREELTLHKANSRYDGANEYVFATRNGTRRERSNVTRQILRPAIKAANKAREEVGLPPLPAGITNHSLRRTFASLLYEAGANPAFVMSQMGHSSSSLALEIYARKMERTRDTGEKMDALVRPNWNGNSDEIEFVGTQVAA
ncbi:MAG: site-specific integrase [Actinomycetota bacterium]|nr:site-specific integrase [Actinomycetota bacterium]